MFEDDCLACRMMFLYMVAKYVAVAQGKKLHPGFGLEQPAAPKEHLEVVSLWKTKEWVEFSAELKLQEKTYNQRDLGGKAWKMYHLWHQFAPEDRPPGCPSRRSR